MEQAKAYFLRILSDFINKRPTENDGSADWDSLLRYAHIHQTEAIVFYQCKSFVPEPYRTRLNKAYSATVFYYSNRLAFLNGLKARLGDIPYFTLKGSAVADFYPIPAMRTMGDVDIVLDRSDRDTVHEIMISLGCENTSKLDDREWWYMKDDIEYELHDRLVYDEPSNKPELTEYFNSFAEHVEGDRLEWDFHFLFLIFHLRKHFMNSGVGFRQFMDLAVLAKYNDKIDWSYVTGELDRLGMLEFAKVCFAFTEKWFGVKTPLLPAEIDETFYEESTNKIFENGIFGFNDEDNKMAEVSNSVRGKRFPRLSMFFTALKRVFPSYGILSKSENYSFLVGRPYLLPAAWVYRFWRGISMKKLGKAKKMIGSAYASSEMLDKRDDLMKKWGLI